METKLFTALAATLAIALVPLGFAVPAAASHSPGSLEYLIATGPICDFGGCPAAAMAASGDTVQVAGSGTLTVHPKSVTGDGTFVHLDPDGDPVGEGTWEANKLLTFISYGSASAQGLPEDFWGGRAQIAVTLFVEGTPVAEAILWVDCVLGDRIPRGAAEGFRLNVKEGLNFNKQVSGGTLFINLD